MSFRMITTRYATLVFAGVILAMGCGGGDSPTQPTPTQPTTPPAPPPPPTVSRIEVSPNTVSLEVGKTQQFTATAKASDGTVIGGVDFTWSSSNTAVATINSAGVATAVSVGTSTIRSTGNGITSEPVTVTVTVAPVSRVTVSPSSAQELMIGETVTFTATARTAGGAVRGDVSVSWTSSDTDVVTITSAGVATAVGAGMATVSAMADGIASSPVTINVAEPPPPEPVVATVTVSPSEAMIETDATQQFTAMATTADGMEIPDVEFTWSSSDEMVATVDADGLATGVGAGEAMITATADSVSGMATLTVAEPPPPEPVVATVSVSPSEAMIETDATQQFSAKALTEDGMEIPDVEFTWSSSDEMVATVDADGLATGVGAGEAMITATVDSVSGMATLTVAEPPPPEPVVATVTVSPSEAMIETDATQQFSAKALTEDGMEIPDVEFTWSSSDELVATVDSDGLATGVGAGEAMITATADSVSGMATLTVTDPPPPEPVVASVTVSPASMMITVGGMFQFMAVAMTADGMVIDDVDFTWMSDDTEVATVDETGLVTAVAAGTAMITATGNGVTSVPATITVEEAAPVVASVEIADTTMPIELQIGDTHQLMAVARTSDGTMIGGVTLAWSSDNNEVATVDSTGLVSAIGAGMADITAMSGGTSSDPVTVTVTEPPPVVDRVSVSPSTASIEEGETQRFTATAYTSDNEVISGRTVTWTSSRTSVATVNPSSGTSTTATGVDAGSTTIRATVDGVSGTATLTVTEPPPVVARVTVSPSSPSIEEGETQRFTATAYTSDNEVISGRTVTWTSSRTSVATVNPSSGTSTTATGVDAGSTTIRATVDGVSGTATLTVTEPPPVVARVTVSPSSPSIEEGETQRFTATAYESDNTVISGKTFRWTSSRTSVATVNPSSGVSTTATGVDAGSTTIRATVDGVSGTATLTVTEPPPVVARVTVSPSTASIEEGETRRFTATARESDNTVIPGKAFAWSSSSTTVATISPSSGTATTATGVSAGSTTITASVDGKSGTATLTVTAPPPPPMLRSRTGTISGRNNYSAGGSVTLSETSDGKLKLSITGLSTPGGAPDVFVALYTSSGINWPNGGSLPDGARGFGEVTGQSGSKSWTFTPASGENIDSWSHLILHCRLINREVGSASLSN